MGTVNRKIARTILKKHLDADDPLGWFEELYAMANDDPEIIPWADLKPNQNVVNWLDLQAGMSRGHALTVGSGLGDDAEELSRRGFHTTAFDISASAVAWSRKRFPQANVTYVQADLFNAPEQWQNKFDFVLELYTLQVLPPDLRAEAARCIASFLAPGGILLVIARAREPDEPMGAMPWPLTLEELQPFEAVGLQTMAFADYWDEEDPPVRRFRATYRRQAI